MRRWLMRQVRDFLGDGLFAVVSLVVGFVLLGYALWQNYDLVSVLNFNNDMVHYITSLLPVSVGRRLEGALRLWGIDHILFFMELWGVVALIMRGILLIVQICWRLLHGSFRKRRH